MGSKYGILKFGKGLQYYPDNAQPKGFETKEKAEQFIKDNKLEDTHHAESFAEIRKKMQDTIARKSH